MTDALAVPFAGSLVERDLLATLRGWETSFGDVGADLDLGWRAHNAGRRVVVVPAARVRSRTRGRRRRGVDAGPPSCGPPRRARPGPVVGALRLALWIAVTSVVAAARAAAAQAAARRRVPSCRRWPRSTRSAARPPAGAPGTAARWVGATCARSSPSPRGAHRVGRRRPRRAGLAAAPDR